MTIFLVVGPETSNSLLSNLGALVAANKEVEDGELVFGEDICIRTGVDTIPDFGQTCFEVLRDGNVEVAFSVSSNVKRTLDVQHARIAVVHVVLVCHGW